MKWNGCTIDNIYNITKSLHNVSSDFDINWKVISSEVSNILDSVEYFTVANHIE